MRGLVAGAVGVAAVTVAEQVALRFTGRPDFYVPARTLERLSGRPREANGNRLGMNWAMHWGQGPCSAASAG